jgi:predicted negative regulator of RcsB-dependent stress response
MEKLAEDDPYQALAKMALAACYEEKGEFDIAIQKLEQLVSGPNGFFKQQAMLSLARIYRTLGKMDKSIEILQQFVNQFQASPFLPIAKAYLDS